MDCTTPFAGLSGVPPSRFETQNDWDDTSIGTNLPDSTGRRNTSMMEAIRGCWKTTGTGSRLSGADPIAGGTDGRLARGPSPILGGNCSRGEDRGSCGRGEGVLTRGVPLVPPRWRSESMPPSYRVRSLLILRRTRGHRDLASSECGRARDRLLTRAKPLDDLARDSPQRLDALLSPHLQGVNRPVALRAPSETTQGRQTGHERALTRLRARTPVGPGEGT
jgi:hypothetical protein